MEELIKKVKNGSITEEDIKDLSNSKKDYGKIEEYFKEYSKKDRTIRETQIGQTQKDKSIKDEKGNTKLVKAIRTIVSFQKKIVRNSVAFEFGNPPQLKPNIENDLTLKLKNVWVKNRMDSNIQEAKILQRSETLSAIIFQIKKKEGEENSIKSKVLGYKEREFWPVFDFYGGMILFCWKFKTKERGKEVLNLWVYDEKIIYKYKKVKDWAVDSQEVHGFDKIPVVVLTQDEPEWEDVKELIDRYESLLSKLGAANNYSGSPLLFTVGKVSGMPDRDSDGKMINAQMEKTNDGKVIHGDAKFLTHDNAPESIKLEQETLEDLIFSLTDTPNLSFNKLKGIGNVAGVALELMFLGSILKAKLNEGKNKTDIQRIVNVLLSGITNATDINLKGQLEGLVYDVKFMSPLPNDLADLIVMLVKATEGKIISREKAIEYLGLVDNVKDEMEKIKKEGGSDDGEAA
ncbi:Phage portal protein [Tenacibaculum sp. 190524A02b]|uniref:phage portal protein n=1 Tax=Tenacibaculum vairaonense TaxID=3137860 RepID=UPI0032B22B85